MAEGKRIRPAAWSGSHPLLPAGVLSGAEVAAQSVATMTPTAAIAITPLLVFLSAGDGTWLAFVIAVALMAAVAYCTASFARRSNSAGSVQEWVRQSLGPLAGHVAGWALILGYLLLGSVTILAFDIYGSAFLQGLGVPATNQLSHVALYAAGFLGPIVLAIRGVRLSARAALIFEGASVAVIAVLCVATFVHQGGLLDHAQLRLSGVPGSGLADGVVLAVFACVGFESAGSLGREAKDPGKHVTRAILGSCLAVGLLYVIVSYTTVFGFENVKGGLAAQAAPLPSLASVVGLGWLGSIVSLAIAASTFGGTIACFNAGARMLLTFGREGYLPAVLGSTGSRTRTPTAAICALGVPMIAIPVGWRLAGSGPITLTADLGTVATFGFMLAYALLCIGAIRAAPGTAARRAPVIAAGTVGALGMVFFCYANWVPQLIPNRVLPALTWPLSLLPYLFGAWVLAGLLSLAAVRLVRTDQEGEA